jgi:aldose 1-epimerase
MSRYAVNQIQKQGHTLIELYDSACNGKAMIVPDMGNNLVSYESNGVQVILPPINMQSFLNNSAACTMYGTPILFPPNRVKNGRFNYLGRVYNLPINEPPHYHLHGEISRKAWEVVELGASEERGAFLTCLFDLSAHPEIMAYFPHELVFIVTHILREGRLEMEIKIENKGNDTAPFAFGLHPYFSVPSGGVKSGILTVPAVKEWPVTDLALVTGMSSTTVFCQSLNDGLSIGDYPELGCSLVTLGDGDRICRMDMKEEGYCIAYQIDPNFPFVVLFKPNWAEAFSIEPYTYVTDAFNLPYSAELTGAKGIRPNEVFQFSTAIWVESIERKQ